MAQPHDDHQTDSRRPAVPGGVLAVVVVGGLALAALLLPAAGGDAPPGPLAAYQWPLAIGSALGGTALAGWYRGRNRERDSEVEAAPRTQRVRTAVFAALAAAAAGVPVTLLVTGHNGGGTGQGMGVPTEAPPTGRPAPPAPSEQATASARSHPAALHIDLTAVLIALAAAALVAGLAAAGYLLLRRRRAAVPAAPAPEPPEQEAVLADAVGAGRRALRGDDARAAVIACYAAMERSLVASGVPRDRADSPADLLARAADRGALADSAAEDAARRLAGLFREARFSTHPMGPGELTEAEAALDRLAAALAPVPAGNAGSGG